MAVKLHRCPNIWVKLPGHPCWKVQKALDDAGIDYQLVKEPLRRSRRTELHRRSGQKLLPAIEFEDGTILREESDDLAARIRQGRLAIVQPSAAD
jgi:glutathione S-transferase